MSVSGGEGCGCFSKRLPHYLLSPEGNARKKGKEKKEKKEKRKKEAKRRARRRRCVTQQQ
ncbi:hypothetical protein P167DRAFT_532850 [Morchella conica CCBAS932]|uniref:Uncharacterized protein n=1 Tax=Morchella conica CCBAS932 TaxID=1392247 RepID=A0A3N4L303_9PEZI|nr:hypothetical protein P167DRAFT_532850 [Morchella conica CCBAS932]